MKDAMLKYGETEAGIYVYLRCDDCDIMISKELITDVSHINRIKSYIDELTYKIVAYQRYKRTLNNLLVLARDQGMDWEIQEMIASPLNNFCDLAGK